MNTPKETSSVDVLRDLFDIETKITPEKALDLITLNKLPINAEVTGHLNLKYTRINPYPGQTPVIVPTSKSLHGAKGCKVIVRKTDGSTEVIEGLENLPSRPIELPKNLTIDGNLSIGATSFLADLYTAFQSLPVDEADNQSNRHPFSEPYALKAPNVEYLPEGLTVKGTLDINHTKITFLPKDIAFETLLIEEAKFNLVFPVSSKETPAPRVHFVPVEPRQALDSQLQKKPGIVRINFFSCSCIRCKEELRNLSKEFAVWESKIKPSACMETTRGTTVSKSGVFKEWGFYARRVAGVDY